MAATAGAFAVAVAAHVAVVVWAATTLPARVPVHWSAGLVPDQYGSRAEFVTAAALAGGLLTALFAGLALLAHRVPLAQVEVPHAEHWKDPRHEPELRRRLAQDALWFGTATLTAVVVAVVLAVRAVDAPQQRLSGWVVVLVVAFVAAMVGRCAWMATLGYRPPGGATRARR